VRDGRFRRTPETRDSGHAQTLLKARSCAAPPHRSRPFRHLLIGKQRIECDSDKLLYPDPKTRQVEPGIGDSNGIYGAPGRLLAGHAAPPTLLAAIAPRKGMEIRTRPKECKARHAANGPKGASAPCG
jgi:hypothetical protein